MSAVRFPVELEVGAATHTGCVRTANEDDFLLLGGADDQALERDGVLVAVADGMGGLRGGAEASRAAIRTLGAAWLDSGSETAASATDPIAEARLQGGFDAACARVHELSSSSPGLKEMGTTLTALVLRGRRGLIGHVGDSRCLRLRDGVLEQLTVDHAMAGTRNLLTRCIGAGQLSEEVDLVPVDVRSGDCFLLCSDGVWSLLENDELASFAKRGSAQQVAERSVLAAVDRGAPDNCTTVVLRVRDARVPSGRSREIEVPVGEVDVDAAGAGLRRQSLIAPRWPWAVLVAGVALLAAAAWNWSTTREMLRSLFGG